MPTLIDTADDHSDLFDRVRAFLKESSGGPGWEELRYDAGEKRVLFDAPGISDDQHIHVGMSLHANVGADAYAIGLWQFKAYVEALGDLEQPGHSGVVYHPVWNDEIPFWAVANGQRLVLASKISTVYVAAHAGKLLPGGTPGEYPQPYYLAAAVASPLTRWSSTSEDSRNFWDPGEAGRILRPDGAWYNVRNFQQQSGESTADASNYVWPFAGNIASVNATTRYRELRENLDGSYALRPLILHGENPQRETMGEIDGVFAISGFNNASENTMTIGGVPYVVVQNMFRTERYYYAAIRLA